MRQELKEPQVLKELRVLLVVLDQLVLRVLKDIKEQQVPLVLRVLREP